MQNKQEKQTKRNRVLAKSVILAAAMAGFVACTGHDIESKKTGDGGLTPPVVVPTGQTDTSAPGATVPTPATPAPTQGAPITATPTPAP